MGWFYTEGHIFDSWQKHRRDEVAEESRVCQDASILLQLEGPTNPRISKKTQKHKNTKSIEIQKYSSSLRPALASSGHFSAAGEGRPLYRTPTLGSAYPRPRRRLGG